MSAAHRAILNAAAAMNVPIDRLLPAADKCCGLPSLTADEAAELARTTVFSLSEIEQAFIRYPAMRRGERLPSEMISSIPAYNSARAACEAFIRQIGH